MQEGADTDGAEESGACGGRADGFCEEEGPPDGPEGPGRPGMHPGIVPMVIGMPIYGSRIKIVLLS